MKKFLIMLSTVALTFVSASSFAQSIESLSKKQVTEMISDKTITTIPLVTIDKQLTTNTFTGFFDKSGTLTGQLANKPDNGPQTDTGTWTVKSNGSLCATWKNWNQSQPVCVSVYQLKNSLIFVNSENKDLETLILSTDIKTGNQLN